MTKVIEFLHYGAGMFGSYSMSFHLIIVEITTKTKSLACSVVLPS